MIIAVRNRARPTRIWLDGVCAVPSAWRSNASTMMMRVKAVITSSSDGSRVMAVISSRVCSGTLTGASPMRPTDTSGREGTCGAAAGAAKASSGSPASSRTAMIRSRRRAVMSRVPAQPLRQQLGEVWDLAEVGQAYGLGRWQRLWQFLQQGDAAAGDAQQQLAATDLDHHRALLGAQRQAGDHAHAVGRAEAGAGQALEQPGQAQDQAQHQ